MHKDHFRNRGFQTLQGLFAFALCAIALFGMTACLKGQPTETAGRGGGVETTDGEILAAAGMAEGTRVRLVAEDYNPLATETFPESLTAFTDANGKYAFKGVPSGRYNLEAFQPKDGTRLFLSGLVIIGSGSSTLPTARLAKGGRLRLQWEAGHRGYLFLRGTDILHQITTEEIEAPMIVLDSLPAGRLPPVFWSKTKTDTMGTPLTDSIDVAPDSSRDWAVFAAWAHHGTWHINTTSAGAGTLGDVTAFPMLVRLSSVDFNFSEAALDGRDIRFSDPDGSELKFQVESWNAAAGRAEIWVRVPKVAGGSDQGAFNMHWGNADADSHSSGPAVFGADNAFAAVLHLNEKGNTLVGGYADATGSGRSGTGIALADSSTVDGVAGQCLNLDGTSQWMRVAGSFPGANSPRSLSVWAKTTKPLARSYLALYGSANDLATFGAWNNVGTWMAWHWGNSNDITTSAMVDSGWHQITMDYDGVTSRFFLDGILVGSDVKVLATTPSGFIIGNDYAGSYPWPGEVDEVEVSTGFRSVDWIKLSYQTQRPGSKILHLVLSP